LASNNNTPILNGQRNSKSRPSSHDSQNIISHYIYVKQNDIIFHVLNIYWLCLQFPRSYTFYIPLTKIGYHHRRRCHPTRTSSLLQLTQRPPHQLTHWPLASCFVLVSVRRRDRHRSRRIRHCMPVALFSSDHDHGWEIRLYGSFLLELSWLSSSSIEYQGPPGQDED